VLDHGELSKLSELTRRAVRGGVANAAIATGPPRPRRLRGDHGTLRRMRILVVGGGIAGLTLATALGKRGLQSELVERTARFAPVGAGITLHPNALRALASVSLDGAVMAAGAVLPSARTLDATGRIVADVPLTEAWHGLRPTIAIHRHALHEILTAAAGAAYIRMGVSVTSLRQRGSEMHIDFTDGTAGVYDLVVGADGVHSTVRRLAFDQVLPRYVGQSYWRAAIDAPGLVSTWTIMVAGSRFLGVFPLGNGRMYVFAQIMTDTEIADAMQGRRERIRDTFADFGSPAREALERLPADDAIHFGPVHEVVQDQWRCGRTLLIGDAAHAVSPVLGLGGGMAIEDAIVLAELLQNVAPLDAALDAFTERRQPRVAWVRERTLVQLRRLASRPVDGLADLTAGVLAGMREHFAPLTTPA
jgi:2-polyprenyl-6-methoxyphenol hydroxylase-like FAD-dependent oxidoreductase